MAHALKRAIQQQIEPAGKEILAEIADAWCG
jgi:hypothetical protein